MPKQKHSPDQMTIDFDAWRRERFALVDSIDWQRSGLTRVRWRHVIELLKAIHACSDEEGWSDAWADTLAEKCGVSRRTLFRARDDALKLGLIQVVSTHNRYGQGRNRWRVFWEQLAALDRRPEQAETPQPAEEKTTSTAGPSYGGVSAKMPTVSANLARGECQLGTQYIRNSSPYSSPISSSPPTPQNKIDLTTGRCRSVHAPWSEVEGEIFKCGVNDAKAAVRSARELGATVEQIREAIAWWRERRAGWDYPEAVLYRRLRRWDPQQQIHEGWPTYREGYRSPEAVAADRTRERMRQKRREQNANARALADAERQQTQEAERRYGPQLDTMSRSELRSLIREHYPDEQRVYLPLLSRPGPVRGMVRTDLLRLLSEDSRVAVEV